MFDLDPYSGASVLVTDFDGTLTRRDIFALVMERALPRESPDFWSEHLAGKRSHLSALQEIFARISLTAVEFDALLDAAGLEPELGNLVERLERVGWRILVVSAGCGWYVERVLRRAGVVLPVIANPGEFIPGAGLHMRAPDGTPWHDPAVGVNKAAIVSALAARADRVAFAGDGHPDGPAARAVPARYRFARGALAVALAHEGLGFRPFDRWRDVAHTLLLEAQP